MATYAGVPVINALSELEHPCQALADFFTLQEHFGDLKKMHFAYVGDGNNMAHSLLLAGASVGAKVSIATPERYALNPVIVTMAKAIAEETKATLRIGTDPRKAVAGADAVYTDAWASMGQEQRSRRARRHLRALSGKRRAHAAGEAACTFHALSARASRPGSDRPGHRLGELGRFRSGGKSSAHSESYTCMAVGRRRRPLLRQGARTPMPKILQKSEKIVLAYSGGLDTSIIIPWLKENYAYEVIAMVADVGQGDDVEAVVNKAYKTGASKVVVEDLREEFLTGYVWPALKAGRSVRKQISAGHFARPSGDRKTSGGSSVARRGIGRQPRMHRQRQRSGPLRDGVPGACSGVESRRAVARVGPEIARRLSRLCREARHFRNREPREDSQPRSQSLAHQPRRWRTRRRGQRSLCEHLADHASRRRKLPTKKSRLKSDSKKAFLFPSAARLSIRSRSSNC